MHVFIYKRPLARQTGRRVGARHRAQSPGSNSGSSGSPSYYRVLFMIVSAFGVCWVIACLLWGHTPLRILQLVLFGSVFEASAVLILGGARDGFPLTPAILPALVLIAYLALKCLLGQRFPGERRVL